MTFDFRLVNRPTAFGTFRMMELDTNLPINGPNNSHLTPIQLLRGRLDRGRHDHESSCVRWSRRIEPADEPLVHDGSPLLCSEQFAYSR